MDRPIRRFAAHGSILPDPHGSDRPCYLSLGPDGYCLSHRHACLDGLASDDAQLEGLEYGPGAVSNAEFGEDIGDMILYRAFGDTQ